MLQTEDMSGLMSEKSDRHRPGRGEYAALGPRVTYVHVEHRHNTGIFRRIDLGKRIDRALYLVPAARPGIEKICLLLLECPPTEYVCAIQINGSLRRGDPVIIQATGSTLRDQLLVKIRREGFDFAVIAELAKEHR